MSPNNVSSSKVSSTDRVRVQRRDVPTGERLVVAISSRALFDLEAGHRVYDQEGVEAYSHYQIAHENDVLEPGPAFPVVRKLLALNAGGPGAGGVDAPVDAPGVEVILLSRNSADTGLRVFNSIQHYGLEISRAAFTGGEPPYRYVGPFGAHLFLSVDAGDVRAALDAGYAAAALLPAGARRNDSTQLRIAFDADAVIFSDEAERVYKSEGLASFAENERSAAREPLAGGPFKPFLAALHRLQSGYAPGAAPIRTALVTARGAPAHERVIRTLRAWEIRIDEALFLGGLGKGEFLKAFGADIFFDDQHKHCASAAEHVTTGHVPYGVANRAGTG